MRSTLPAGCERAADQASARSCETGAPDSAPSEEEGWGGQARAVETHNVTLCAAASPKSIFAEELLDCLQLGALDVFAFGAGAERTAQIEHREHGQLDAGAVVA